MQLCRLDAEEWICRVQDDIVMGKSAPSAPAAPDPVTTANAQSAADINTAIAQGELNKVNQVTPYGSLTYSQTGSTSTPSGASVPQYTANIQLTPAQQQALESQQGLTQSLYDMANQQTGRIGAAIGSPFDMSNIPKLPTDPSGINQDAVDKSFKAQMDLLNPQMDQQQQLMEDTLAHQGIQPGNDASLKEEANFQRTRGSTEDQAAAAAVQQGMAYGAQTFGQQTQANELGVQEQAYLRELPLNEAIALEGGGQIQNPSFVNTPSSSVSPTDVLGATGLSQSAKNTAFQAQVQQANSTNQAEASLAAAVAMAAASAASDERLKKDVKPLASDAGAAIDKLKPVEWNWKDGTGPGMGMLAQSTKKVIPQAVIKTPGGGTAAEPQLPGGNQAIDYRHVVPLLVAAVQDMRAERKG